MALDANLYTLTFDLPSQAQPQELTLSDSDGSLPRYTCKRLAPKDENDLRLCLVDSLSNAELASLNLLKPCVALRMALISLNNPTSAVELYSSSRLSWAWSFTWEESTLFTWKRDTSPSGRVTGYTLYVSRKPDADFPVCLWRAPSSRSPAMLQMLDYNLHRIDVQDRFGLEVVMCTSICRFLDWPDPSPAANPSTSTAAAAAHPSSRALSPSGHQPLQSPRLEMPDSAPNEVRILDTLTPSFLIGHCLELLKDESFLFLELKAFSTPTANKAVHVAQEVKRAHAKSGQSQLFQYVIDPSQPNGLGKPNKLKGRSSDPFEIATSLTIYLSRIPMDELAPKQPSSGKPAYLPEKPEPPVNRLKKR